MTLRRYLILACILVCSQKAIAETLNERLSSPGSHTTLVFELPIVDLQSLLVAVVSRPISGQVQDVTDALKDDTLAWRLQLHEMALVGSEGRLEARGPLIGDVQLHGRLGSGLLSTEVSQRADVRADATLSLSPKVRENWSVDPEIKGDLRLHEAEISVLGIRLSLRSLLQPLVDQMVQRELAKLATAMQDPALLQRWIEPFWETFCVTRPIGRAPAAGYLVMVPERVAVRPLEVTSKSLRATLVVSSSSHVQVTSEALTCPPIPATLDILE